MFFKRKNGVSVLEAILSLLLMSILMTAVYAALSKGFYALRFGSHKIDSYQPSLKFVNKVYRELLASNYYFITIDTTDPNNPIISIPSPYDATETPGVSSDGQILWYKYIYYYKTDSKIWRKVISMGGGSGSAILLPLEEFYFPDNDPDPPVSGIQHILPDYKTMEAPIFPDIDGPSAAAYYVDSLSYTKDDTTCSVIVNIEIISPKNKENGLLPSKHRLAVVPKNTP